MTIKVETIHANGNIDNGPSGIFFVEDETHAFRLSKSQRVGGGDISVVDMKNAFLNVVLHTAIVDKQTQEILVTGKATMIDRKDTDGIVTVVFPKKNDSATIMVRGDCAPDDPTVHGYRLTRIK